MINIDLQLAQPDIRAGRPDAFNPSTKPEPPCINDPTIKNPRYIEINWSNASLEYGGNDAVFDLPRVIAINQLGGTVRGLLSPARYVDAFDIRLSTQEQSEAFREAMIGTAMYLLPLACKRFLPCEALAAKGGGTFANYMRQVETLDVSTARNGAVFYSGPGNRALGEQFAIANGRTTLEMRFLDVFSGMMSASYSIEVQQVGPEGPENKASNEFEWAGIPARAHKDPLKTSKKRK